MDVVKADLVGILHDLDLRTPRILDEGELEFPLHVADLAQDLDPSGLVAAHLRRQILEGKTDVGDRAAVAAREVLLDEEDHRHTVVVDALAGSHELAPHVLGIPGGGLGCVGGGQM